MSPDEHLVLTLTVYGNAREGMPTHQASGFAREATAALADDATADDAINAFNEAYKKFRRGG